MGALRNLGAEGKTLMVSEGAEGNFLLSVRNLKEAKPIRVEGLNVYDIMGHEHLLCTKGALGALSNRIGD